MNLSMNLLGILIAIAFYVVTMVLFLGAVLLAFKFSRKGRHPIGKDVKLLRQPGEGLRQRIEAIDEKLVDELLKGLMLPSLAFLLPLLILLWPPALAYFSTVISLAGMAYFLSIGYCGWSVFRWGKQRRDCQLGLVGERIVANELESLKPKGYHVFHDAPAQGAGKAFNLDHIVVGPSGLFCIETKARRKYAARNGGEDHKVGFDGETLIWPNGRDGGPVRQARNNAEWLERWICQRLGRRIVATPLLAIPGWYTDEKPHGNLRVLSQKRLGYHIQQGLKLDANTVNLIALQLDSLCRDVPCDG